MLLQELRVMRGPNPWSEHHHQLVVLKLSYNDHPEERLREKLGPFRKQAAYEVGTDTSLYLAYTELLAYCCTLVQPGTQELHYVAALKGKDSYYAVFGYEEENTGVAAAEHLCEAVENFLSDAEDLDIHKLRGFFEETYPKFSPGPSTGCIIDAAIARGIPCKKIPGGLYVLGYGKYKKRVWASIIETTGNIGVDVAGNKEVTKKILHTALIPVPIGYLVRNEASLQKVSEDLGYPLVTKPLDGHKGKGITSNITLFDTLVNGFHEAQKISKPVIVEKHIQGNDYRFLVVGYKCVAAAKRVPACVTGNGSSSIKELIEEVNKDPKRGEGHGNVLTKIKADEATIELLASNGLTLDSVPAKDERVYLKDTANLSTGGTAEDVTDDVHPDNILLAERAAKIVGLDICGIDIMAPDITTPITQNGGAVLEANAAPGLRMHISPSSGKPRNVGEDIVDWMFPEGNGRIPIVAVTGTNGKTTTSRIMAHIAGTAGYYVGFTSTDGVYINDRCIHKGDCSGPQSTEVVLQEPSVDFAVLECARGGIIRSGLAFKECDVAIVTNVAADHLGLKDIYTVEDLAEVKSVVPKAVSKDGYAVLNAANDLVYAMREKVKCKVALFCLDPENERVKKHCAAGGIAITLDESKDIIIWRGEERIRVEHVKNIPLTMDGKAGFMIENVLSAVLAAHLMGFTMDTIRQAITTFGHSAEQTPGRLNVFDINHVKVLVDYAHNPHGLRALSSLLKQIDTKKTGIITGVGDRRDEDIREVGKIAAGMYDAIVVRIDEDTRGRTPTEIYDLIVEGINEKDPNIAHHFIPDSKEALKYAINNSSENDYVVISADDALETIEIVKEIEKEAA